MNNSMKFLFPITLLALTSCGAKTPTKVDFSLTDLGNSVEIHTELQLRYINSEDYTTTSGIAAGSSEKSIPEPVHLSWDCDYHGGKKCTDFTVELYEVNEESNKWTYSSNEPSLDVYNLKINTEYGYSVTANYGETNFTSEKGTFKTTSKAPRNLFIDNVINARDLGGYGLKQGLLFRNGRFNETDGTIIITEDGLKTMKEVLKIKTEIDLRRDDEYGDITVSPLGEDVNYRHLAMVYGGQNVLATADNRPSIKAFFETLAVEENYPISFHCAIGKDRTGCMAYVVGALCGVEEEYLYRDYLFSNFAKIGGMCQVSDIDNRYGMTLKDYANGSTLQEKTYNYLHEVIGVSTNDLDSIRNILIDK